MKKVIHLILPLILSYGCATSEYAGNQSRQNQSSQNEEKDYTIYRDLTDALRAEGLYVQNGEVTLRGKGSIFLNTSPLFVVDEVPFGHDLQSVSSSLNMQGIKDIQIIRSTSRASLRYGEIANHGAILIYTNATGTEKKDSEKGEQEKKDKSLASG